MQYPLTQASYSSARIAAGEIAWTRELRCGHTLADVQRRA